MGGLGAAVRDIHAARRATDVARRTRRLERAGVAAVDALLGVIEEGHLARANRRSGMRPEWQAPLEKAGLNVSDEVRSARNTAELHERLLIWQDELLNRRDPTRCALLAVLDGPDLDAPFRVRGGLRPRRVGRGGFPRAEGGT